MALSNQYMAGGDYCTTNFPANVRHDTQIQSLYIGRNRKPPLANQVSQRIHSV